MQSDKLYQLLNNPASFPFTSPLLCLSLAQSCYYLLCIF